MCLAVVIVVDMPDALLGLAENCGHPFDRN